MITALPYRETNGVVKTNVWSHRKRLCSCVKLLNHATLITLLIKFKFFFSLLFKHYFFIYWFPQYLEHSEKEKQNGAQRNLKFYTANVSSSIPKECPLKKPCFTKSYINVLAVTFHMLVILALKVSNYMKNRNRKPIFLNKIFVFARYGIQLVIFVHVIVWILLRLRNYNLIWQRH